MSSFDQITKRFSKIPVLGVTTSRTKERDVSGSIGHLFKYLHVQPYQHVTNPSGQRRLVFQYNVTFDGDFYILNLDHLQAHRRLIVSNGVLCIKWRIDNNVFRYKLLDSEDNTDWSGFVQYTNQRIKRNFCLEFWATGTAFPHWYGIVQEFFLQTSYFFLPESYDDTDTVQEIEAPPELIADLGVDLPENLPYNQDTIVWIGNYDAHVVPDNGYITLGIAGNPPGLTVEYIGLSREHFGRTQFYNKTTDEWVTVSLRNSPPEFFLGDFPEIIIGPTRRINSSGETQFYNVTTDQWHTVTIEDGEILINIVGEANE